MLANRVREFSITVGTGDITLGGAIAGHVRFSDAFAVGESVIYVVEDGDNYEIGTGTYGAGNMLVRASISETLEAGVLTRTGALPIALTGQAKIYSAVTAEFLLDPTETADVITEATAGAGVTVDDVLLKDGTVTAGAGAFTGDVSGSRFISGGGLPATPGLAVFDAGGFYQRGASQIGFAVAGADAAWLDAGQFQLASGVDFIVNGAGRFNGGNVALSADAADLAIGHWVGNHGMTIQSSAIGTINFSNGNTAGTLSREGQYQFDHSVNTHKWLINDANYLTLSTTLFDVKTATQTQGLAVTGAGSQTTFDSGALAAAQLDFKRGGVLEGFLSWDLDTVTLSANGGTLNFSDAASFGAGVSITDVSAPPLVLNRNSAGAGIGAMLMRQANTTDGNAFRVAYQSDTTGVGAASNVDFASLEFAADTHDQATRQGSMRVILAKGGVGVTEAARFTPDLFDVKTAMSVVGAATFAGEVITDTTSNAYMMVDKGSAADTAFFRARTAGLNKWGLGTTGDDNFALYSYGTSHNAMTIDFATDATTFAGNLSIGSNNFVSWNAIYRADNTSSGIISGGSGINSGANIRMFGGANATLANDMHLRVGATPWLSWDNSANTATFAGDVTLSSGKSVHVGGAPNAFVGIIPETDINLMLGTGLGAEPRIYLFGSGNGQANAGDIFIGSASGAGTIDVGGDLSVSGAATFGGRLEIGVVGSQALKLNNTTGATTWLEFENLTNGDYFIGYGSQGFILSPDTSAVHLAVDAVTGNATFGAQAIGIDGSAAAPSFQVGTPGNGIYRAGTDIMGFAGGGGLRMSLSASALSILTDAAIHGTLDMGDNSATPRTIEFRANRTTDNQSLGAVAGYWNGTRVSLIDFQVGNDTINQDNGQLVFYTAEAGTILERGRFHEDGLFKLQQGFEVIGNSTLGDISMSGMMNYGSPTNLTIAAGVVTVTKSFHTIDTEAAAASDDLDTINGGTDGDRLVIYAANGGHTVVLKDNTGNLRLAGDMSLVSGDDTIELIFSGTVWRELSRSNNA